VVPTIKVALNYAMDTLKPDIMVFASSDNSEASRSMYKVGAEATSIKHKV
jgi:alkyl hydroperoxide reductase subunit AhpF